MKKFKVKHGANEPAAYAACALKNFKIEPKDKDDKVYYGVFDFGGGTTDFDFGIWKLAEDEDKYDYELEHFGAGGDKYLGGENIIKGLAYKVFTENSDKLLKKRIQYIRPESYDELEGEGVLINNNSSIAKLNTRILGEILRGIWENSNTEDMKTIKLPYLYDTHGEKRGMGGDEELSLNVSEEKLKDFIREKIDKGINNFFIKLEDAFKDEDVKKVHIFLAGNSCRHSFVNEIFEKYVAEMKDKIDLIYISLSGNTDSFVKRLRDYLLLNTKLKEVNLLNVKELVKNNIPFNEVTNPFVAFLPTYLEGGNGIDNGDKEILTTPLREYIRYKDNYKKCLGIVGSGNKNFNNQYCLTAKQYSQEFGFPVLYNFELRGLDVDIQKVSSIIEALTDI